MITELLKEQVQNDEQKKQHVIHVMQQHAQHIHVYQVALNQPKQIGCCSGEM